MQKRWTEMNWTDHCRMCWYVVTRWTKIMEQSDSFKPDRRSDGDEFLRLLRNPKVHFRVNKSLTLYGFLIHMNSVYCLSHFNIKIKPSAFRSSEVFFLLTSTKLFLHLSILIIPSFHPPWFDHKNICWIMKVLLL